jgi:hypothetical protein
MDGYIRTLLLQITGEYRQLFYARPHYDCAGLGVISQRQIPSCSASSLRKEGMTWFGPCRECPDSCPDLKAFYRCIYAGLRHFVGSELAKQVPFCQQVKDRQHRRKNTATRSPRHYPKLRFHNTPQDRLESPIRQAPCRPKKSWKRIMESSARMLIEAELVARPLDVYVNVIYRYSLTAF